VAEAVGAFLNHKISPTQNGPLQSICVHHTGAVPVREYTVRFDSTPVPNFIANINCVGVLHILDRAPVRIHTWKSKLLHNSLKPRSWKWSVAEYARPYTLLLAPMSLFRL